MTAPIPTSKLTIDRSLDLLRADIRAGYACIATFDGPRGMAWMEIRGPKGMRPTREGYLTADVPTLRLWVPEQRAAPLVEAAANRNFDEGLRAIEEEARSHLHPPEWAWLGTVLQVIRDTVTTRRPRITPVGGHIITEGHPLLEAWASCLTLGDLEAAVMKAVA